MRLFPAQSRSLRNVASTAALIVTFALPATGTAQNLEVDVEDLRSWAEARAADSRLDQVALRFGPVVERLREQERMDDAVALLQTWFRLSDGASAAAAEHLVEILLQRERFDALLEIVKVHRRQVGDEALALEAALASWELGRLGAAESEFLVALAGDGGEPALATYQWARFLSWSGRSAESWAQFERLLGGRFASSADVVLGAARVCRAAAVDGECDAQRALELTQRAVNLLPDHTGARYSLVRALDAVGEKERSRAEAEAVRALLVMDQERTRARGRSEARAADAEVRLRQAGAESAYELLCGAEDPERCLSRGDWRSAEEWLVLARVLWGADERAAAISLLERLVATHPDRVAWRGLLFGWRRDVSRASN